MKREASKLGSSYYPPRAGLLAGLRSFSDAMARRSRAVRELLCAEIAAGQMLLGLGLPGYGFHLGGHDLLAGLVLGCWGLTLASFGMLLGAPPVLVLEFQFDPAYLAFGLAIALHATSATYLITRLNREAGFRQRVLAGFAVAAVLIFVVYFPIWSLVQRHFIAPHAAVVQPSSVALSGAGVPAASQSPVPGVA